MQQELSHGGFNMLNIYWQECSLKFVWLRRALKEPSHQSLWQNYIVNAFVIPFHLLLQLNIHPRKVKAFIKKGPLPPFWTSLLNLWFKYRFIPPTDLQPNVSELLQRPVCYNSCMQFTMKHMHKMYAKLATLNIFTIEDFLRKKHLHRDCWQIGWLARRMPIHWLTLNLNMDLQHTIYGGIIHQGWSVKAIYAHLRDSNYTGPPAVMTKWARDLGAVSEQEWSQACKGVQTIRDTRLRAFHLLFLNRGYALHNSATHYLNVSPQCRLCGQETETYLHLFWNCDFVQLIIDTVREVGILYLDQEEDWLTQNIFLLGNCPCPLPKLVALLGKRFIFMTTNQTQTPLAAPLHPITFISRLKAYISTDKLRAKYAAQPNKFYKFWQDLAFPETFQDMEESYRPPPATPGRIKPPPHANPNGNPPNIIPPTVPSCPSS